MGKTYGSKKQMEKEGGSFKPFKSGSYIARFTKLEVAEKKNFDGDVVPTLAMQFSPYEANTRAAVMKDIDGGTVKPLTRRLFMDINKVTMGFRENFTIPSKYRALVAALQHVDPNDDVEGPDELTVESAAEQLEQYLGDYVVLNVAYFEKNGKDRNKITDILEAPEDFEADHVIEAAAEDAAKKKAAASKDDDDAPRSRRKSRPADDEDEDDEEVEEIDDAEEEATPKKEKKTRKALF